MICVYDSQKQPWLDQGKCRITLENNVAQLEEDAGTADFENQAKMVTCDVTRDGESLKVFEQKSDIMELVDHLHIQLMSLKNTNQMKLGTEKKIFLLKQKI